jgi:spore coat protein CotH
MKKQLTLLFAASLCFLNVLFAQSDFYDMTTVHEVKLRFEQKNWATMLDSLRINGDEMLLATITLDGKTFPNVGVSYRNIGYQTAAKRNTIQVKLNFIDRNQNYQGYTALKLSNALRDPSMVREVLGYEIARKYMPAPKANYVNVSINGENRGVYVNVEPPTETFLKQNFGGYAEGSLFRCAIEPNKNEMAGCDKKYFGSLRFENSANCYMRNFEMRSKHGWDDLIELTRILNNEPQNISKILVVDRTLWLLAFNNVCVNLNSYSGGLSSNYHLYRDQSGRFTMILGDLNLAFGSYKNLGMGTSDLDLQGLQELDPLANMDNVTKPLIVQLMKNAEYKKIYLAHIRQIMADWFDNEAYKKRAEELQRLIQVPFINDQNKPYTTDEFQRSMTTTIGQLTKIPGIVELMSKRVSFLRKHPEMLIVPPKVSEIQEVRREKYAAKTISEFTIKAKVDKFPKRVTLYYRVKGENGFNAVEMLDDGQSKDGTAGDKIFGTVINPMGKFDHIEYYIAAENTAAISFEPSNYMYELRKASLEDLNK